MSHFGENKFSCGLDSKRLKRKLLRVYSFKVKSTTIFLFKCKNNFCLIKLLPKIFQLIVKLISLKFKEVISIVKNNDYHFIFDLIELYFSVIVKFSDLIKLVPKNILIFYSIKINVKVKLKYSSLYEISDAF